MPAAYVHCPFCGFPAIVAERADPRRCRQCWRDHLPACGNAAPQGRNESRNLPSKRRAKLRTHLRTVPTLLN